MTESRALTAMESFQDSIKGRIRDEIAQLLPDDVVKEMINRVVEEEFFKERRIPKGYGDFSMAPSNFVEQVTKAAGPIVQRMVTEWVAANEDVLKKALNEFLQEERLLLAAMEIMHQKTSSLMLNAMVEMAGLVSERIKRGY